MFREYGIDPENPGSADADGGQQCRNKGDAKAPEISGHDIIQHTEQIRCKNNDQAGVAQGNDLRVTVEERQQEVPASEYQGHCSGGCDEIFQQRQCQSALAAVNLSGAEVLSDKGGACLAECVERIVDQNFQIVSGTGCGDDNGSQTVDGSLNDHIGQVEYGTLDSGRKADLEDPYQTVFVNPQFSDMNLYPLFRLGQFYEQDQGADGIGQHGGNGYTIYVHPENDYKQQVQQHIQNTGKGQCLERNFGVADTSEDGRFKVIKKDDRKSQQVNANVQKRVRHDLIGDVQQLEQVFDT